MSEDLLDRVAAVLRRAPRVTVVTGAGVSAASGVPTFRGAEGLWRTFRPEDLATPEAFARDPALVWEWYDWRRQLIADCRPNRAHDVLAAWQTRFTHYAVITQNVDGLHERAGLTDVTRLHGSIWELACWSGCGRPAWSDVRVPLAERPPRCPTCGGLARPAVVWFGEGLDPRHLARAVQATACDVFITAGTSSVVYPAAGLVHEAHRRRAVTVEINPEATPATDVVDVVLRMGAEQAFDDLDQRLSR